MCLLSTSCAGADNPDESSSSAPEPAAETPTETPDETPTETPADTPTEDPATAAMPLGTVTVDYEDLEGWRTTVDVAVAESRPMSLEELTVDHCPRAAGSYLSEFGDNMAIKVWVFEGSVTYHGAGALDRPENTRINVTMNTNGDMSLTGLFACSTNDVNNDFFPPFGDPTVTDVAHPIRWVVGGATEATPNDPEGDMADIDAQWTDLDLSFTNSDVCTATTTGAFKETESVISYPGCGVSPTRS